MPQTGRLFSASDLQANPTQLGAALTQTADLHEAAASWRLMAAALADDVVLTVPAGDGRQTALVPPGVPCALEPSGDVRSWRRADWIENANGKPAIGQVSTLTAKATVETAGETWEEWIRTRTERYASQLIARMRDPRTGRIDEDHARETQAVANRLCREIDVAPPVPQSPPSRLTRRLRALRVWRRRPDGPELLLSNKPQARAPQGDVDEDIRPMLGLEHSG